MLSCPVLTPPPNVCDAVAYILYMSLSQLLPRCLEEILSSPLALSLAQMLDEDDASPGSKRSFRSKNRGNRFVSELSAGQRILSDWTQKAGPWPRLDMWLLGVDAAHIYPSEGSKLHGSGFCRP